VISEKASRDTKAWSNDALITAIKYTYIFTDLKYCTIFTVFFIK